MTSMPEVAMEWQNFDQLTADKLYELLRFRHDLCDSKKFLELGCTIPGTIYNPFLAGNGKFESIPLQRTVGVSRDIPLLRRKAGLFRRVCGAEQVARSGETGVARSYGADRRQYLCRAKFQYRSVDDGDGLMRRIGQRPSRARYADCARSGRLK